MTIQFAARKDPRAAQFEAAGLQGRGFMPLYRVNGGEWKVCRESRGAEGLVIIWQQTAQAAQQYARKWVAKNQKRRTATTA